MGDFIRKISFDPWKTKRDPKDLHGPEWSQRSFPVFYFIYFLLDSDIAAHLHYIRLSPFSSPSSSLLSPSIAMLFFAYSVSLAYQRHYRFCPFSSFVTPPKHVLSSLLFLFFLFVTHTLKVMEGFVLLIIRQPKPRRIITYISICALILVSSVNTYLPSFECVWLMG